MTTCVEELDQVLRGGLFKGSATLWAGPSGTGKTTIAAVFAAKGAIEVTLSFTLASRSRRVN
ncbi:MAG: hypothetical protein DRJ98_04090 [Thermoprotei archaeon]|nr:MAG: hypothetical protein DRJ98_04090 [Thermoprotei archaeon]RLF18336.1 MAG: hypothetical protein DRN06_01765 [Thermoprotei archaeon]